MPSSAAPPPDAPAPMPFLIGAAALSEALSASAGDSADGPAGVRVVDVRPAAEFAAGHVPGSVHLDPALLNRAAPPANGLLPDRATAERIVAEAGIGRAGRTVVLDAGGATTAARAVWVLHAWGLADIGWLDGGLRAWGAAGGELERGDAVPAGAVDGLALPADEPDARTLASADELHGELGDARLRVLDVRGAAEYAGTDVRSAEGGRVPGAIHLEWTRQLDPEGRALSPERLREQLAELDVRPEHRVVVYCQTHQRSAVTWLLMRSAGFPDVRGLDGAWSVWGNRPELPKERG